MASNTVGTNNTRGSQEKGYHVDTSHLLALIRNQRFEGEGRARAHLAVCEQCQRAYVVQAQTSRTLDVLGQMAHYQRYPELQSRAILVRAQESVPGRMSRSREQSARGAYRSGRSRGSLRLVSIPVGMIIALATVVMVLAFTLAKLGGMPMLQGPFITNNTPMPSAPGVQPHQTPPTAVPTHVAPTTVPPVGTTPSPTNAEPTVIDTTGTTPTPPIAVASPTPTVPTAPDSIYNCTTPKDLAQNILDICGNNFIPGHKAQLVITALAFKHPIAFWAVRVDVHGQFTYRWYIWSCKWDPITAYVQDISSTPPVVSNTLGNLTLPSCTIQTGSPTPTPGDY